MIIFKSCVHEKKKKNSEQSPLIINGEGKHILQTGQRYGAIHLSPPPSLSLSFPGSDAEDVSAWDRCLLPLVSKLNMSCWARHTLIKINISIFSKRAWESEREQSAGGGGKNIYFLFSSEKSDSNWRGKKGKNKRSSVIFLHLDGFRRHKKDKLITTQQRIYPINKDHASTASSYSLVSHYSIISPSVLSPVILHRVLRWY